MERAEWRPRRPTGTALHAAFREGFPHVLVEAEARAGMPRRVRAEVGRYLGCGDVRRGFERGRALRVPHAEGAGAGLHRGGVGEEAAGGDAAAGRAPDAFSRRLRPERGIAFAGGAACARGFQRGCLPRRGRVRDGAGRGALSAAEAGLGDAAAEDLRGRRVEVRVRRSPAGGGGGERPPDGGRGAAEHGPVAEARRGDTLAGALAADLPGKFGTS